MSTVLRVPVFVHCSHDLPYPGYTVKINFEFAGFNTHYSWPCPISKSSIAIQLIIASTTSTSKCVWNTIHFFVSPWLPALSEPPAASPTWITAVVHVAFFLSLLLLLQFCFLHLSPDCSFYTCNHRLISFHNFICLASSERTHHNLLPVDFSQPDFLLVLHIHLLS